MWPRLLTVILNTIAEECGDWLKVVGVGYSGAFAHNLR